MVPFPGFRIERESGDLVLRVERIGGAGIVDVSSPSGELVDVETGTHPGAWRIETTVFSCRWPEGFALAHDPSAMSPFLLLGPADAMLWIDGPIQAARATPIEKLAAPGQNVREVRESADAARIDLDYLEDGVRFWQRRVVVRWSEEKVLVLSAQAPKASEKLAQAALDLVERTLERLA